MSDEFRVILFSRDRAREQFITAMNHAAAMLDNGDKVLLTVGPALEPIGIQQRKFFHGPVLTQISEQVRMADGTRYTADVWKIFFKKLYLPPRWISTRLPGQKRPTPRRVEQSTERLGVKAYSFLIDQVIDHAISELNVTFQFEDGEREGVRYVAPKRKSKELQPA